MRIICSILIGVLIVCLLVWTTIGMVILWDSYQSHIKASVTIGGWGLLNNAKTAMALIQWHPP